MLRRFWLVIAAAVAVFVGYQTQAHATAVWRWFARMALPPGLAPEIPLDGFLPILGAVAAVIVTAFILVFVVLAIMDGLRVMNAIEDLEELGEARRGGEPLTAPVFLGCFGDTGATARAAADYAASLHQEHAPTVSGGETPTVLRATVAARAHFSPGALVDGPLYAWFFRTVPWTLGGIGAIGLAFGLLQGTVGADIVEASGGPNFAQFAAGASAGLLALGASLVAAVLVGVVLHALLAGRYLQTERLIGAVDALFRGGAEVDYLRDLARVTRGELFDLRMAVRGAGADVRSGFEQNAEKLEAILERNGRATATALAETLRESLKAPVARLADAARAAGRDQASQVKELLSATLTAFVGELDQQLGNQTQGLRSLLESSRDLISDLQRSIESFVTRAGELSDSQTKDVAAQVRGTLETMAARETESRGQVLRDMETLSATLGRQVEDHSQRFASLLAGMLTRVDDLTRNAVATSGADLRGAAEAFGGLQTVLESLSLSATPLLNQVVDLQEQLLRAIKEDTTASRTIASAATDLNAAARVSRETVEKFVVLASRLSETSKSFGRLATAESVTPPPSPPPPVPVEPVAATRGGISRSLSQAVQRLRDATEDSARQLPKL